MAPASSTPATAASVIRATSSGGSPNERMPMMALAGLVLQSAQGPKAAWRPTARTSSPMTRYMARACSGSPVAPRAMLPGPGHEPGYITCQAPSWSAPSRTGMPSLVLAAKPWIRAVIAAAASGSGRLSLERYEPPTK